MTQKTNIVKPKPLSKDSWRSLWRSPAFRSSSEDERGAAPSLTDPLHCDAPALRGAEIAAVYTGQRVGGDFYEFLRVEPSRLLFVLLDIAGLRTDTRATLIALQRVFRMLGPALFGRDDFNETTAMIELCHEMNRTVMRGGIRSCPAFIGCYNEELGTVGYANAGHTPGMLRDGAGIALLEATGLPLGLFSHTTQSAAACHLVPGSALVLVTRGFVEADCESGDCDDVEFGMDRAKQTFQGATAAGARELCLIMLQATRQFTRTAPTHNDLTTLALVRNPAPEAV
ncbi:MAG: PP2C family protein-serine/threonine phosphatase [Terriglobales bacterium]